MDIAELSNKFNISRYIDMARECFWNAINNEENILDEIGVKKKEDLKLQQSEICLVFQTDRGYSSQVIKYHFEIQILENTKVGYYEYIIDLQGDFIDEFLVINRNF